LCTFCLLEDIIYRTLKKENILFASDGYIKLFDFEFAKFTKERTYTLCGTPDVMYFSFRCFYYLTVCTSLSI